MIKVVIDTNILFSGLLSKRASQRKIILSQNHRIYTPNYVFVELFKYKEKILQNAKAAESEVYEFLTMILGHIHFVHPELISKENRHSAYVLCHDIDPDDIPFVALTLQLDAVLWTGDNTLKNGLIQKGFDKFLDVQGSSDKR